MPYRMGGPKATMARGMPARSGTGGQTANPAAASRPAAVSAWSTPTSSTIAPPGVSRRAAWLAGPLIAYASYVALASIIRVGFLYEIRPNVRLAPVSAYASFKSSQL